MDALGALRTACRTGSGPGRAVNASPGTLKAVTAALLHCLASWPAVSAALQCMATVLQCSAQQSVVMRLEGGVKACVAVLRRYPKRAPAVLAAGKMLARAVSVSQLTAVALHRVRPFLSRLFSAFLLPRAFLWHHASWVGHYCSQYVAFRPIVIRWCSLSPHNAVCTWQRGSVWGP